MGSGISADRANGAALLKVPLKVLQTSAEDELLRVESSPYVGSDLVHGTRVQTPQVTEKSSEEQVDGVRWNVMLVGWGMILMLLFAVGAALYLFMM